jgi:hypothetical protein
MRQSLAVLKLPEIPRHPRVIPGPKLELGSAFSCFSNELAARDKVYLSDISFLSAPSVEYSGSFGNRRIQYKLKGNPLKIAKVNLQGPVSRRIRS